MFSSINIIQGFPGLAAYSGTKFFVEGISQAMRLEVASQGVKVTCIQPGDVRTNISNRPVDEEVNTTISLNQRRNKRV